MSKLAAGQDGREAQAAELQRGEEVDQNPIIVVDDEQPQIGQSSSTHDDSGIAPPAATPKMFSLFQPGVRDPGTSSSSSTSRSSRGRAAKDKKVDYSDAKHAKAGLEDEEGDFQVVGSSSTAAPPAPKRGRPRKKAVSPAPPPPKAPSPAPLPPLSLNVKGNTASDAPVHSFFALKASAPPSTSSSSNAGQTTTLPARAPKRDQKPRRLPLWPDRENIHVQPSGEDATGPLYAQRSIPFETIDRKGKGRARSIPHDHSDPLPHHGLARRVRKKGFGRHKAIASSSSRQPPSSLAWTDQWRPNRADDVVDNEEQARYLRDWMRELEITTSNASRAQDGLADIGGSIKRTAAQTKVKQPRVQTSVPKAAPRKQKRRRRGGGDGGFGPGGDEVETLPSLDDFIVYDDEYEDDAADYAPSGSSSSRLTNCIVLTGPSGAGKTAAVYACATELNFEVFELFPGMGKRGAKELHQAVGDLARNHMVSGGGSGGGAMWGSSGAGSSKGKSAFDALMKAPAAGSQTAAAAAPSAAQAASDGDDEEDGVPPANSQSSDDIIPAGRKRIHLKGRLAATTAASSSSNAPTTTSTSASAPSPSSAPAPAHALASSPAARQSLILIEEVDVLSLEEDRSFWSGVIDLVASSRRPIVLTCNDVSAVPLADLPVQEVLRFQRPCRGAMEGYLGGKVEGGKEAVKAVLEAQAKMRRGGAEEGVDLRQAILQLQFTRGQSVQDGRAKAAPGTTSNGDASQPTPTNDLDHLRSAHRSLNATSFALAHLSQPFARHAAEQVAPGVPQSLSVSGGGSDEATPTATPAQPRVQADGRSSTHRPATPEPSTESDTLLLQSFTSSRPQVPRSLWAQVSAAGQGYVALPEQSSRRERQVLSEVQVRAHEGLPSQLQGDLCGIDDDDDEDEAELAFNKLLSSAQQTLLNLVAPISPLWLRLARHLATGSGNAPSPPPLPAQLVLEFAPLLRSIVRIEDAEEAKMKHLASILGVGQQEAAATAAADQQAAAQASSSGATAPPRRVLRSGHVIGGPGGWERTWTLRWHKREDYDGWFEDGEDDEGIVDGCEMARRSGEAFKWGLV